MKDVGVQFAKSSGKAIPAQVLPTELTEEQNNKWAFQNPTHYTSDVVQMEKIVGGAPVYVLPVAELLGQVDVQNVREDADKLRGIA